MTVITTTGTARGAIAYHNLFRDSSVIVTSSGDAAGYDKENAYDWLTHDFWQGSSLNASLVIDAGVGNIVSFNYIGIAAHNLGTVGGTVLLQHSSDGITYTTLQTISPSNNDVVFSTFATESHRFIRILNSVALAKIGVISTGMRVDLPVGMRSGYTPLYLAQRYKISKNITENAQFVGSSRKPTPVSGRIALSNLTQSWARATWPGIRDHLESPYPIFFTGENAYNEAQLLWMNGTIRGPKYDGNLRMSIDIPVVGQA